MTYDFLALLDTSLELGNLLRTRIVKSVVDLMLADYAQALLGIEFLLANISGVARRGHLGVVVVGPATRKSRGFPATVAREKSLRWRCRRPDLSKISPKPSGKLDSRVR